MKKILKSGIDTLLSALILIFFLPYIVISGEECQKIESTPAYYLCLKNLAVESHNQTYCDIISDKSISDDCRWHLAVDTINPSVCAGIFSERLKDNCYLKITKISGKNFCEKINSTELQKICEKYVSESDKNFFKSITNNMTTVVEKSSQNNINKKNTGLFVSMIKYFTLIIAVSATIFGVFIYYKKFIYKTYDISIGETALDKIIDGIKKGDCIFLVTDDKSTHPEYFGKRFIDANKLRNWNSIYMDINIYKSCFKGNNVDYTKLHSLIHRFIFQGSSKKGTVIYTDILFYAATILQEKQLIELGEFLINQLSGRATSMVLMTSKLSIHLLNHPVIGKKMTVKIQLLSDAGITKLRIFSPAKEITTSWKQYSFVYGRFKLK